MRFIPFELMVELFILGGFLYAISSKEVLELLGILTIPVCFICSLVLTHRLTKINLFRALSKIHIEVIQKYISFCLFINSIRHQLYSTIIHIVHSGWLQGIYPTFITILTYLVSV